MVRKTSKLARQAIIDNGLLSRLKRETYLGLYEHGPCTAGELFKKMGWHHTKNNHNVSSRLGELRDAGCVDEICQRPCSTNGNIVIEWDVNDRLPVKIKKKKRKECPHCDGTGYVDDSKSNDTEQPRLCLKEVWREFPDTRDFIRKFFGK